MNRVMNYKAEHPDLRWWVRTSELAAFALFLGLTACGTTAEDKVAAANSAVPKGTAFEVALHKEYVQQANLEAKEYDFENAEIWADKALAASARAKVAPEKLGGRSLPKEAVPDMTSARARLLAALAAGAANTVPGDTAHAQVMFDCWVEEQEENVQPDDIRACRSGFEAALANVESALKPKVAAKLDKNSFIVYFDTDKAIITNESKAVLSLVLSAAKKSGASKVVLGGYTDRAGSNAYNEVLSKKRVDSVAANLVAAGLSASVVNKSFFGEENPIVATADGQSEKLNRRVEISVE